MTIELCENVKLKIHVVTLPWKLIIMILVYLGKDFTPYGKVFCIAEGSSTVLCDRFLSIIRPFGLKL